MSDVPRDLHRAPGAPTAKDWQRYVTGLVSDHAIPCRHNDMAQPEPVAQIARILAGRLAKSNNHQPAS